MNPFRTATLFPMNLFRLAGLSVFAIGLCSLCAETLVPLSNDQAPQSFTELWKGFDPRAEPLDTEILHEWEEENVILKVVRYRIGIFKGKRAMMAGIYGYPKGGSHLPALLNIHGGGQYADYRSVLTNAQRGYATLTIAWAGRLNAPEYRVTPSEVSLFWEGKVDDPNYKITTDWGALDAYHAPSRNGEDAFVTIRDGSRAWTYDDVPSPRNNSWFLVTLGARRALTFLERQAEVDGNRLGVYGHSMGGKLTVATAATDHRVKAAAPSCGGISDRYNLNPIHGATVGDAVALKHIQCPTIFLSPANDFHGHINNLIDATQELRGNNWRITSSPHLNHRDYPENEVATQLWFDQHLKGRFTWPTTPQTRLNLVTPNQIPTISVKPDPAKPILSVEVYYTQQGKIGKEHRINRMNRYWHYAPCTRKGDEWEASLPLFTLDDPVWVYANVVYALDQPVSGAGYYYGTYTADKFNLSSLLSIVSPAELRAANVAATLQPSQLIESFAGNWEKNWYHHDRDGWGIRTHKIYHPRWKAPSGSQLTFEVFAEQPHKFVVGLDDYASAVSLRGAPNWQSITLSPHDFTRADDTALASWEDLKEFRLLPSETLRSQDRNRSTTRNVGQKWKGARPQFRNLRWID